MLKHNELQSIEMIEKQLIYTLEKNKTDVSETFETIIAQFNFIEREIFKLERQYEEVVKQIADLKKGLVQMKEETTMMSKEITAYDPETVRDLYEHTHELQTEVIVLQQEEQGLADEKRELTRALKKTDKQLQYVDQVHKKINIMLAYFKSEVIDDMAHECESACEEISALKLIEAQENEKKRIAREIHDGPAQLIVHLLMRQQYIEQVCKKGTMEEAQKEFKGLRLHIEETLEEVRKIIFDLRPMTLDDYGLLPTLKYHIEQVQLRTNLNIDFHVSGFEERLQSNVEIAIFRMIQEALQNIDKHAKAMNAVVRLEQLNEKINIQIKDDGQGFNMKTISKNSYGLAGIKERVDLLEGKMAVQTEEGQGTEIDIQITY
ncbi:MAG TPA: histidine kinase [Pseudogracilibacillus sp.]|nr:histidine kinase [Pseudogracilibacillus sp.]